MLPEQTVTGGGHEMGASVAAHPVADEADGVGALPAVVVLAHSGEGPVARDDAVHTPVAQ